MYVTVRNDGARNSQDTWIFAGDLLYTYDNLTGLDKDNPQFVPIGLAVGSQSNLIFATAAMLKTVGGEHLRVIPIHEDRLNDMFPSRLSSAGLQWLTAISTDLWVCKTRGRWRTRWLE